jgi:hypothetical protein
MKYNRNIKSISPQIYMIVNLWTRNEYELVTGHTWNTKFVYIMQFMCPVGNYDIPVYMEYIY